MAFDHAATSTMIDFNQRWSPSIGDPSVMGWVTVGSYFIIALCCLLVRKIEPLENNSDHQLHNYRRFWLLLAICLIFLGINKQLDLQSLFTQIGRDFALSSGWYEHRKTVQKIFIATIGIGAMASSAWLIYKFRYACGTIKAASFGFSLLLAFVVMRAASFHSFDNLIKYQILGIKFNWLMEISTLMIIATAALSYRKKYI